MTTPTHDEIDDIRERLAVALSQCRRYLGRLHPHGGRPTAATGSTEDLDVRHLAVALRTSVRRFTDYQAALGLPDGELPFFEDPDRFRTPR